MADVSESFVASIAQALNSEQVPCVLWGHYLLNVHGVPSVIGSVDFVIPDDSLIVGTKALAYLKSLIPCPDAASCPSSSEERHTPPPACHVHIEDSEKHERPSQFILASDKTALPPWRPGRGSGVFKTDHVSVIVPKSEILLKAFLRLYARDSGKRIGAFAIAMIGYMEEYVDEDGLLDANQLPEPLKAFYRELRQGEKPVRQWTKELREALGIPGKDTDDDSS